jgi:uncharacterized membrane protein
MATVDLAMLVAASAACVAILIFGFAGRFFCRSNTLPPRSEVRRHMLCGLYCNPDDPRAIVHRPYGAGWTINVRREVCAHLLIVLGTMAIVSGVIYLVLKLGGPTEAVKFVP